MMIRVGNNSKCNIFEREKERERGGMQVEMEGKRDKNVRGREKGRKSP